LPELVMYWIPAITKMNTQAIDAKPQSMATVGVTYDCMALDAAEALASSVKGKPTSMGYFPNALVARSVTMLLITKAAMTIANPTPDQISVCLDLSRRSGLPELVI
jgi:hypothetical protein